MTKRFTTGLFLFVLCVTATAQTARDSSGRVSDEGPYRSQVRLLQDRPTQPLSDDELLQATAHDAYGRALVLRQLAQRGISSGDTAAAISHFEQALQLDSLSDLAVSQMQINLGQLYTLANRHGDAIRLLKAATASPDFSDPSVMMSLANAYLQNNQAGDAARQAVKAITAADAVVDNVADKQEQWIEFVVYAFWKSGEPARAAPWQLRLLETKPDDTGLWLQLAALYQAGGQPERALATLQAAALSGLIAGNDDRLTLIQMHLEYGTPDIAAQWLKPLVDARPDAQHWQWLGQVLHSSGDEDEALAALTRWAELESTPAAWLEVGELAVSLLRRDIAVSALRSASKPNADGAIRGRALLLLGQVEMELGNYRAAKQAFKKASEYGGVYRTATDWLDFLNRSSTDTSTDEAAIVAGPLNDYESQTDVAAAISTSPPADIDISTVNIKNVPALRVYAGNEAAPPDRLAETATNLAKELIRASRRERLMWTGPLHIVVNGDISNSTEPIDIRVAAPIRRSNPPRGQFRSGTLEAFHCVWRRFEGPASGLEQAWRELYQQAVAAGLEPTMQARQIVLHQGNHNSNSIVELQIGIL